MSSLEDRRAHSFSAPNDPPPLVVLDPNGFRCNHLITGNLPWLIGWGPSIWLRFRYADVFLPANSVLPNTRCGWGALEIIHVHIWNCDPFVFVVWNSRLNPPRPGSSWCQVSPRRSSNAPGAILCFKLRLSRPNGDCEAGVISSCRLKS
jgi:hypothetical protein